MRPNMLVNDSNLVPNRMAMATGTVKSPHSDVVYWSSAKNQQQTNAHQGRKDLLFNNGCRDALHSVRRQSLCEETDGRKYSLISLFCYDKSFLNRPR
jgi:hypothetical protein